MSFENWLYFSCGVKMFTSDKLQNKFEKCEFPLPKYNYWHRS